MKINKQSLDQFLSDLGSKKPAPGGGSASALSGAMAAALVKKITSLTLGKEKYAGVENEVGKMDKQAKKLISELSELGEKDARAYLEVIKTKGSQAAVQKAAEVPLKVAQKSRQVLEMAIWLTEHGNQNLRSDALVAIELARAGVYGALENVKVNLPYLKDENMVKNLEDEIQKILGQKIIGN